jgi:hypothetical protein
MFSRRCSAIFLDLDSNIPQERQCSALFPIARFTFMLHAVSLKVEEEIFVEE